MKTLFICFISIIIIVIFVAAYFLRKKEQKKQRLIIKMIEDLNDELEKNPDIMSVSTTDNSITLHPKVDRITAFAILESKLALYGLRLEDVKEEQNMTTFTAKGIDDDFCCKIHWNQFSCILTIE